MRAARATDPQSPTVSLHPSCAVLGQRGPSLWSARVWGWAAWLVFTHLTTACGGAAAGPDVANPEAAEPGAEATEEVDLKAQFRREAEPIAKQPVSARGAWSAYMEAKTPPTVVSHDKFVEVVADLGWDSEVRCFVYQQAIDSGGAANAMLRSAAENVQFKAVTPYSLERDGLVPMVGIRGVYHVEKDGVLLAGDYKLMVMPRSQLPMVCVHDAPGFADSFMRVTTEFAKSFKYENDQSTPARGELWAVTMDDVPVGFAQHSTYELDDGKVRRVSLAASFVPKGPGELAFEDRVSVVTTDKEGQLLDGKYITSENGETSLSVDIERSKRGYDYVGTIQNKEVRGTFKSKRPLLGSYALERRIKSMSGAHKKASFEQWEYTPGIDPAQASKVTYDVTPEGGAMVVVASMGQRALTMRADNRGIIGQVLMPIGSRTVKSDLWEATGDL